MSDDEERALRIRWLEKQMAKADFDMDAEHRRARLETWRIIISVVALVIGAFAAGAAWWNYFGHH